MAKMDDQEFEAVVGAELTDAITYIDDDVSPYRAQATDYYLGKPFGNEEEGRSQMVSQDVRDTVNAILPSLMRVFFSSERVVEYTPVGPEDVANAEQATDYANHVFTKENDGFSITYAAFKDSLIRKCGFIKAWWDEKEETKTVKYTGLDEDTLTVLQSEADAEVTVTKTTFQMVPTLDPASGQMIDLQLPFYDCTYKKTAKKGMLCVAAVPPEELLIDRRARSLESATLVAHRRMMTVSDLIALGYKPEEIEDHAGDTDDLTSNPEYLARTNNTKFEMGNAENESMRRVLYIESYIRIDYDGDGIAELRRVCTVGNYVVVSNEPCDMIPFADFPCDPEPHLSPVEATSIADLTMDIMRQKSDIWRNASDSLAQTITPRTVIIEGQVNVDDVLNNEVGAVIRAKSIGAVTAMPNDPSAAQQGFAFLQYADAVKERRTGMSDVSMGLDTNALSGTSNVAIAGTLSASQGKIELTTRILANGMKRLFKVMLHLMITHQDKPKMVRLRKEWVQVDPRVWNAEMDVTINVALGTGTQQDKLTTLGMVAQKQELILMQLGPSNPLVSLAQYGKTLSKMVELAGFKDSSAYFAQLPDDFKMPPQQPQQDPAMLKIQAEQQKHADEMQFRGAELQQKDVMRQHELSMEAQKNQMQAQADMQERQHKAELDAQLQQMKLENDRVIAEMRNQTQLLIARLGFKHQARMQASSQPMGEEFGEPHDEPQEMDVDSELFLHGLEHVVRQIADGQQQLMQAMYAPRIVVRDGNNKVIGTKPAIEGQP